MTAVWCDAIVLLYGRAAMQADRESGTSFVLVHGAYQGPWCWDLVVRELVDRGHTVRAPELPISDPEAGTAAYAEAVLAAMRDLDDPVIVAHSMGGVVAPLVAAVRPVRLMVFLAAFLPEPGTSPRQQREVEPLDPAYVPSNPQFTDVGENVWRIDEGTAIEMFYHDVPDDLARWAVSRLRPQSYRWMDETTPLESWPDVPSASIVCTDDRAINADWVRQAAIDRLGVEAREISGGHFPLLARPAALADLLTEIVAD